MRCFHYICRSLCRFLPVLYLFKIQLSLVSAYIGRRIIQSYSNNCILCASTRDSSHHITTLKRAFALSAGRGNLISSDTRTDASFLSDELLEKLLSFEVNQLPSLPKNKMSTEEEKRIDELIDDLTSRRASFDPLECINGPLYATVYTSGGSKQPLWETISELIPVYLFPDKRRNIKGQQYTILDRGDSIRPATGTVVNYAEIFGEAFNLKAYGNFTRSKTMDGSDDSSQINNVQPIRSTNENTNFLSVLDQISTVISSSSSLGISIKKFFKQQLNRKETTILKCPVSYDVMVTKASISFLGKSLDINISGIGCARVLYADQNLRIFISPVDTIDRGISRTQWESTGLVVVQIRTDLIYPKLGVLDCDL